MFTPVAFAIGIVQANDPDVDLTTLRDAISKISTDTGSGYLLDPQTVAFANRHPDPAKDILVEVQALTKEAHENGVEIVTNLVKETIGATFDWEDVTEAALAYHAGLKNEESGQE